MVPSCDNTPMNTAKIVLESSGKLMTTLPFKPEEMQPGMEVNWHEEGRGWQMYTITEVVMSDSVALVYVRENRWGS